MATFFHTFLQPFTFVPPLASAPKRGLFLRIVDAVAESNRRKADREIARFIERSGGKFTDDLERRLYEPKGPAW